MFPLTMFHDFVDVCIEAENTATYEFRLVLCHLSPCVEMSSRGDHIRY